MTAAIMPLELDRDSCEDCHAAKARADHPIYRAQCRGCAVRSLACGPVFFQSGLDGSLSAPYRKALCGIFGDAWRQGHDLVKAEHARIKAARQQGGASR